MPIRRIAGQRVSEGDLRPWEGPSLQPTQPGELHNCRPILRDARDAAPPVLKDDKQVAGRPIWVLDPRARDEAPIKRIVLDAYSRGQPGGEGVSSAQGCHVGDEPSPREVYVAPGQTEIEPRTRARDDTSREGPRSGYGLRTRADELGGRSR